jgi:hypothetical protein
MLLLLFRGHDAGGPAPAAPTPDDRDVSGLPSRNFTVTGLPSRNAAVSGAPSKNSGVTGRPPNP